LQAVLDDVTDMAAATLFEDFCQTVTVISGCEPYDLVVVPWHQLFSPPSIQVDYI
jgi:hypothetical protein